MRQLLLQILRGSHPDLLDQVAPPTQLSEQGACVGTNPRIMDGETLEDIRAAQAVCADCPVAQLCLDWAVSHEAHGVWGGKTPGQRATIRGKAPFVTVQELNFVRELRHDLTSPNKTAVSLATKYDTSERQIYRWKDMVA